MSRKKKKQLVYSIVDVKVKKKYNLDIDNPCSAILYAEKS
jgi:hypothetical protein